MIRNNLVRKERIDFEPINIAYEPNYDESVPVPCYFRDQIHLAYKSYVACLIRERREFQTIKLNCHYCQNFFAKNNEAMKKYFSICRAKEGITYSFDNGQILGYQDNFKYQDQLPFSVYFDFETATGNAVFLTLKCM